MHYFFAERILDPAESLVASEGDFEQIRSARNVAVHSLAIEEKYGLVLANYREFELTLTGLALDNLLFRHNKWTDHIDSIRDANRVVMNLLSSIRAYLDQMPQHLGLLFGSQSNEVDAFKKMTNVEYDASFGYRIVYALRNHAQHNDFPVHSLSLGSQWIGAGQRDSCAHTAIALSHRDEISENKGLNARLRAEVAKGPEKIDLRPAICETMSALARIHSAARQWLQPTVEVSANVLTVANERFKAHAGRDPIGLCVIKANEEGRELDSLSVFLQPFERRDRLAATNSTIDNLEKHFIAGRKLQRTDGPTKSHA